MVGRRSGVQFSELLIGGAGRFGPACRVRGSRRCSQNRRRSALRLDVAGLSESAELAQAGRAVLCCADGWSALALAARTGETIGDRWRAVAEVAQTHPTLEEAAVSSMARAVSALELQERP